MTENKEKVITKAFLAKDCVSVTAKEGVEGLSSRGYGRLSENDLNLSYFEALYLIGKGIIELVDDKNSEVSFQSLLRRYRSVEKEAWFKYLIYRDLRSRGYVVKEGFGLGIDFRLYERGEFGSTSAAYLIFGIQEGNPIAIDDLVKTLKYARNLKKNLILAVLNRRGEVVYYSISESNF